ncbi:MAG: D-glycerate dehydrogenase [Thermoanaerobaculales bacterium]|jgi:glyoxylate reductase|nr:D-glycerate dehydrogenase [Thermoanaerobaculales bacterium]
MRGHIAVTSELPGKAVEQLEAEHEVWVHRGEPIIGEDELAAFIGEADAVLTLLQNPVTEAVLQACPMLRVVANCAVGFDNVDLEAAAKRRLWVTNTPDVLTEATADLTWALILAVTRRVGEAERLLRSGRFRGWALDMLLGSSIQDRQLGIIGCGRIGRAVARRAVGFGMSVACSGGSMSSATPMELDELLATSHVVSIHAPLNDETRHLINERRLRLMPEGSFLINTARGPIVDEAALARVLADGHLGGAGLDVFESEPAIHPGLTEREDVVLLPHIGSATVETRSAMAELAAANILAVLAGGDPPTPVVRGYVDS